MKKEQHTDLWTKLAADNDVLNGEVDPKDFCFDDLWTAHCLSTLPERVLESVKGVRFSNTDSETYDLYEITTKSGLVFMLEINYYFRRHMSSLVRRKEIQCKLENDKVGEEFYRTVGEEREALAVFSLITKETRPSTLEVFKAIYSAAESSFQKVKLDDIAVMMVKIDSDREQKLALYGAIVEKFYPHAETFVDRTTEMDRETTLLVVKPHRYRNFPETAVERTVTFVEGTKDDILTLVATMAFLGADPVSGQPSFEEQVESAMQKIFPMNLVSIQMV